MTIKYNTENSDQPWLKHYPKGVPHEIDLSAYNNTMEVFDHAIRRFRNRPAYSNMGESLSFEQLDQLSGNLASFFQNELNLKKGDRIAIQLPNVLQYPVVLFAAHRLGLIVVNTNPLYTAHEMKHQFNDSGAVAIVILANFAHLLEAVISETQIRAVVVTEIGDLFSLPKRIIVNSAVKYLKKMIPPYHLPQAYAFNQALRLGSKQSYTPATLSLEDTAFLQYTGGTTGVSKGAVLTHKNIIANMLQIYGWMKPQLKEGEEIVITALPMYHIFSLTVNALAFMHFGGHNILITNPRDIPQFIKTLQKTPFTLMTGVNTLFQALMNHPDFLKINFKTLKLSVAGAMPMQRAVSERWHKMTGTVIAEGYGLTEASPVLNCNPIDGTEKIGTIGLPLPSTEIRLFNDNNVEVKIGESGELWARGPQIMQGYYNRPEETALVMQNGWLKTGDIAIQLEGGFFKIVDRKKDMILVSGFNVYPNEVEDAISSHPDVLEVAAIGIPSEQSGEAVKVFIVSKTTTLTAEDIIQHARKNLTSYKIPKSVEFRTELPKTNVGKILRRALRLPVNKN
jgi:long-chain acyl-CoA synthetase